MLTSPPSYNLKLISPHQTPGSGIALVVQLNPPGIQLPKQLAMLQANTAVGHPAPPPVTLRQAPPFYNSDIDTYQHGDILRLIEFYNDSFGIVLADMLATRKQKVHTWMAL